MLNLDRSIPIITILKQHNAINIFVLCLFPKPMINLTVSIYFLIVLCNPGRILPHFRRFYQDQGGRANLLQFIRFLVETEFISSHHIQPDPMKSSPFTGLVLNTFPPSPVAPKVMSTLVSALSPIELERISYPMTPSSFPIHLPFLVEHI